MVTGTTTLSQKYYAEEILKSHGFWDISAHKTPVEPNTRFLKENCDPSPYQISTVATVALKKVLVTSSL